MIHVYSPKIFYFNIDDIDWKQIFRDLKEHSGINNIDYPAIQ